MYVSKMGWDFWTFKQAVNRPKFRSIPVYGPDFEPIRNALNARKLGPSFGPYTWLLTRLVARHSGDGGGGGGGGGFQQNERLVRRPPPSASAHAGGNSPPWPKSSANAGFFVGAASVRSGRTRRAARGGRRHRADRVQCAGKMNHHPRSLLVLPIRTVCVALCLPLD
ncbi:Os10g0457916 [Oryza sativa Japonica Group]|uniref:Os10g0457916 protein n=1 Tax=Oryza sativa subsp. japonica TaxID=39947 RepID=A0A0P0XUV5_ORYSJ|nr:Os10g0457916 [Oryza sativa Japonica Group]